MISDTFLVFVLQNRDLDVYCHGRDAPPSPPSLFVLSTPQHVAFVTFCPFSSFHWNIYTNSCIGGICHTIEVGTHNVSTLKRVIGSEVGLLMGTGEGEGSNGENYA